MLELNLKKVNKKTSTLLSIAITIAFTFSTSSSIAGDTNQQPSILSVKLYIKNGYLTGDIFSTGLFSDRITGTIQSGLPAVVKLDYRLIDIRTYTIFEGEISWKLQYDLWDNIYSVSDGDTTSILNSFESMKHLMENLRAVSLLPARKMIKGRPYKLALRISVSPFRMDKSAKEISSGIEENLRSYDEGSRREKVLDLNSLVSLFLKRKKGMVDASGWYRSKIFSPEKLYGFEQEVR